MQQATIVILAACLNILFIALRMGTTCSCETFTRLHGLAFQRTVFFIVIAEGTSKVSETRYRQQVQMWLTFVPVSVGSEVVKTAVIKGSVFLDMTHCVSSSKKQNFSTESFVQITLTSHRARPIHCSDNI
jgi:hypothetical protein